MVDFEDKLKDIEASFSEKHWSKHGSETGRTGAWTGTIDGTETFFENPLLKDCDRWEAAAGCCSERTDSSFVRENFEAPIVFVSSNSCFD